MRPRKKKGKPLVRCRGTNPIRLVKESAFRLELRLALLGIGRERRLIRKNEAVEKRAQMGFEPVEIFARPRQCCGRSRRLGLPECLSPFNGRTHAPSRPSE